MEFESSSNIVTRTQVPVLYASISFQCGNSHIFSAQATGSWDRAEPCGLPPEQNHSRSPFLPWKQQGMPHLG